MSTISTPTTAWSWPPDVVVFAEQHEVDAYLDPLLRVLQDLFPTARSRKVILKLDPELHDDWHIVFEVRVAAANVPDFLAAQRRWHDESFQVCPASSVCLFRLMLVMEDS